MIRGLAALALFASLALSPIAGAEPYLAVRMGLKCAVCHENPTGGGLRTAFGNTWAQTQLAERSIDFGDAGPWTGVVNRFVSLGADLRAGAIVNDVPNEPRTNSFDLQELRAYLQLNAIPNRLSINVDQRLAPGTSSNLEAYGKLWLGGRRAYVKAGQFYLPFGLRLEDDTAFTRTLSGINMTTPDNGIELGWDSAFWTGQLAVSNGTAGAPEQDSGKQWSVRAEHVRTRFRLGASVNFNSATVGDRTALGVHAGIRTGPLVWLGEIDRVADDALPGSRELWAGLAEVNWMPRKGHNLKLTAEFFEPDRSVDEDEQTRFSLLWEYSPLPFLQLRIGARVYEGIPQNDLQNRRLLIGELHAYF